jgi:hypothetical protein
MICDDDERERGTGVEKMDAVYHRIDSTLSTFGICTDMQVGYIVVE